MNEFLCIVCLLSIINCIKCEMFFPINEKLSVLTANLGIFSTFSTPSRPNICCQLSVQRLVVKCQHWTKPEPTSETEEQKTRIGEINLTYFLFHFPNSMHSRDDLNLSLNSGPIKKSLNKFWLNDGYLKWWCYLTTTLDPGFVIVHSSLPHPFGGCLLEICDLPKDYSNWKSCIYGRLRFSF